jgi:hypothetical protein
MRNRRGNGRPAVSLFPFLSILVCLMGVLAFITVAVALLSAANPIVRLSGTDFKNGSRARRETTKQPVFIECHGDRLVIHPQGREVPLERMEEESSPFLELIDRLALNREREYVIFAVYPDGIRCFGNGRRMAEQREIDLGFEPMLQGWQLRFDSQKQGGS